MLPPCAFKARWCTWRAPWDPVFCRRAAALLYLYLHPDMQAQLTTLDDHTLKSWAHTNGDTRVSCTQHQVQAVTVACVHILTPSNQAAAASAYAPASVYPHMASPHPTGTCGTSCLNVEPHHAQTSTC